MLQMVHARTRDPAATRPTAARLLRPARPRAAPATAHRRAVPGHRDQQHRPRTAVGRRPRRRRNQPVTGADPLPRLGLGLVELSAQAHLALLDVIHGRLPDAHRRAGAAQDIAERRGWASEPQALALYAALALTDLDGTGSTRPQQRSTPAWPSATAARTSPADWCWPSPRSSSRSPGATRPRPAPRQPGWTGSRPRPVSCRRCWHGGAPSPTPTRYLAAGQPQAAIERLDRRNPEPSGSPPPWNASAWPRPDCCCTNPTPRSTCSTPTRRRRCRTGARGRGRILAAVAADRTHRDTAALAAITDAIDLAHGVGMTRPFLAAGPQVAAADRPPPARRRPAPRLHPRADRRHHRRSARPATPAPPSTR